MKTEECKLIESIFRQRRIRLWRRNVMDLRRIELLTPCLQSRCSPS